MSQEVESALGGNFLSLLRHECHLVGLIVAGDADDRGLGGKLQVELDGDGFSQHAKIAVLNMASILAEVQRDAIGATKFSEGGCPNRIGLVRSTGLSDRGYVIDIDAEVCHRNTNSSVRMRGSWGMYCPRLL
jgi:hypothetical protein